ncbi:MAG TPA: flavin reductase family protein [Herpetosiphonaceae bacterium]
MLLDPADLDRKTLYKLAIGLVVPRPIAWVSTLSAGGVANLAPYSYFNVASSSPLMLLFCPNRQLDGSKKDTLVNIEQRPEFVIHIVAEDQVEPMNLTSAAAPPEIDEFALADLPQAPGAVVEVPRIESAAAAFECRLHQIVPLGDAEVVIGRVVAIHMRDEIYRAGYVLLDQLRPVGRMAGNTYLRCHDTFDLPRPRLPEQG